MALVRQKPMILLILSILMRMTFSEPSSLHTDFKVNLIIPFLIVILKPREMVQVLLIISIAHQLHQNLMEELRIINTQNLNNLKGQEKLITGHMEQMELTINLQTLLSQVPIIHMPDIHLGHHQIILQQAVKNCQNKEKKLGLSIT